MLLTPPSIIPHTTMADEKEPKAQDQHVEDATSVHDPEKAGSIDKSSSLDEVVDAKNATDLEHNTTLWQGIKRYRKAVFWSFAFSLCIVMDGYDLAFTGTLYAHPAFQRQFGQPYEDGYEIPAKWQSAMTSTLKVGHIIGLFLDGYFSEIVGRKRVSLVTLVALAGIIFMQFFAKSLPVFMMGRFIAGIPLGVFQAAANTYAAEVCPVFLRAYLTTYVCVCWIQVSVFALDPSLNFC